MSKQTSFFKQPEDVFGGELLKGNPREARPLSVRRPIHLVMRSSKAVGSKSMLKKSTSREVEAILRKHAERCGVKIYDFANGGNHLHLTIRIKSQSLYQKFIRIVTGLIARVVLKAQKAKGVLKAGEKFWDARPFTRLAHWGRNYEILKAYLTLNKLEALGFVKYQTRDHKKRKIFSIKIEPFEVELV